MAQNLGQLLGVDPLGVSPFPVARRVARAQAQDDELPANYGTGFSPDGMSYEVIKDFGKLAAQALADYEARLQAPRNDIWGKTLREDTPEFLDQTILEPARRLIGGSQTTPSPVKTFEIGNQIVRLPEGGKPEVVFSAPPKTPDLSFVERQLYKDRSTIMGKKSYEQSDEDLARLKELNTAIAALEAPKAAPENSAPAAPPMWQNWPQQGSFIGTPGSTNNFIGQVAPFIGTNAVARPQSPVLIKTGSGKSFKITPR